MLGTILNIEEVLELQIADLPVAQKRVGLAEGIQWLFSGYVLMDGYRVLTDKHVFLCAYQFSAKLL